MNHLTPKLIGILLLATSFMAPAQAEKIKPDYEFKELEKVRSIRDSGVDGWAAINDQALIMTVSPKRKYLVILQRPDYDLACKRPVIYTFWPTALFIIILANSSLLTQCV